MVGLIEEQRYQQEHMWQFIFLEETVRFCRLYN